MGLPLPLEPLSRLEQLPDDVLRFWHVWRSAREARNGATPFHSGIKVTELRELTARLFVAERNSEGEFFLTMSGSGFDDLFGRNLTGENLTAIAEGIPASRIHSYCNLICSRSLAGFVRNNITTSCGKIMRSDGLTLPVAADDGEVRKVICYSGLRGVGFSLNDPALETTAQASEITEAFFVQL